MENLTSTDAAYTLPISLTVETVEAVVDDLRNLPMNCRQLTINASRVEIITSPGVQMLVALAKTLSQRKTSFSITQPNEVMRKTFQALGLQTELAKWSVQ